jgi:hypothetical protein
MNKYAIIRKDLHINERDYKSRKEEKPFYNGLQHSYKNRMIIIKETASYEKRIN